MSYSRERKEKEIKDKVLHEHELNEFQQQLINATLDAYIGINLDYDSEDDPLGTSKNPIKVLNAMLSPHPLSSIERKQFSENELTSIEFIREILNHPYPQNRGSGSSAALAHFYKGEIPSDADLEQARNGIYKGFVYYYSEESGKKVFCEPVGKLALTVKGHATKDGVRNYIRFLIQKNIAFYKKKDYFPSSQIKTNFFISSKIPRSPAELKLLLKSETFRQTITNEDIIEIIHVNPNSLITLINDEKIFNEKFNDIDLIFSILTDSRIPKSFSNQLLEYENIREQISNFHIIKDLAELSPETYLIAMENHKELRDLVTPNLICKNTYHNPRAFEVLISSPDIREKFRVDDINNMIITANYSECKDIVAAILTYNDLFEKINSSTYSLMKQLLSKEDYEYIEIEYLSHLVLNKLRKQEKERKELLQELKTININKDFPLWSESIIKAQHLIKKMEMNDKNIVWLGILITGMKKFENVLKSLDQTLEEQLHSINESIQAINNNLDKDNIKNACAIIDDCAAQISRYRKSRYSYSQTVKR